MTEPTIVVVQEEESAILVLARDPAIYLKGDKGDPGDAGIGIQGPQLAGSLQVALLDASLGRTNAFALIWGLVSSNILPEYKNQWANYAQNSYLPGDFIEILLS